MLVKHIYLNNLLKRYLDTLYINTYISNYLTVINYTAIKLRIGIT